MGRGFESHLPSQKKSLISMGDFFVGRWDNQTYLDFEKQKRRQPFGSRRD
jgi:hypothetical protein